MADRIVRDPDYVPTELRSHYGQISPGERIHHGREGYQRLVVGYRDDDPTRFYLAGDIRGGISLGRCVDCGHEVYGDPGAVRTMRERDAVTACMWCNDSFRYRERAHQSGLVVQL